MALDGLHVGDCPQVGDGPLYLFVVFLMILVVSNNWMMWVVSNDEERIVSLFHD